MAYHSDPNHPVNKRVYSMTPSKKGQQLAMSPSGIMMYSNDSEGEMTEPVPQKPAVNTPSLLEKMYEDHKNSVNVAPKDILNDENGTLLSTQVPQIDPNTEGTSLDPNKYNMDPAKLAQEAAQGNTSTAGLVDPKETATYDVDKTQQAVADADIQAAQGTLSDGSIISDVPQIDTEATGKGENEVGKALNDFAELDLDDVDARATTKGQLELLQQDFTDKDGNPKIPNWAAGTARNVSKIASFSGMTGTAATAAMAQAIMEASLPVATQDAAFYQTVSLTNLNNKQQSIINKANVLSQMDLANLDARMTAAVTNSQAFLQMDMTNLNNEQQARVINNQNRVQSILEDSKQENAKRLFTAESTNELNKFYDSLNSSIDMFNSEQLNGMEQFNVSEDNAMKQFNAQMENTREEFYKTMQYNVDAANAKWRQNVTVANTAYKYEAAAMDVQNAVGISTEQLNQMWDRTDAVLDYIWKSTNNELDRDSAMAIAKLQAESAERQAKIQASATKKSSGSSAFGSIVGTVLGGIFGK